MNSDKKYFGNWFIECELGSGSFGTVYKIKKEEFGITYYSAMKVIRIPQDKSEKTRLMSEGMDENSISTYYYQFAQDFIKEIELMADLQGNTNIVGYNDHLIEENNDGVGFTIYIRMEYLTPLDKCLVEQNKTCYMAKDEVIKLGIDMCNALEVCSKKHIIHRDIKPDNIFISENGDYKLGDFGIARKLESTQSNLSKKGTYTYMAPEIYNGNPYNCTVDIYSLGIVLYRLLNKNRTPFLPFSPAPIRYTDKEKALVNRMSGVPIPQIPNIPDELNKIILKACAFNPKNRYQSVEEFKTALLSIYENPTLRVQVEEENNFESSENEIQNILENDDTVSPLEKPEVLFDKSMDLDISDDSTKTIDSSSQTLTNDNKKRKSRVVIIIVVGVLIIIGILAIISMNETEYTDTSNTIDNTLNTVDTLNYTYEEVIDGFTTGLLTRGPTSIDTYVIPYAEEINSTLSNINNLNYVDPTMDFVDGLEFLTFKLDDCQYSSIEEDLDYAFDLHLNYFTRDDIDDTYYSDVNNDLEILNATINEVFSSHGLQDISVDNYIYELFVLSGGDGSYKGECEVGIVETSIGCFILAFE